MSSIIVYSRRDFFITQTLLPELNKYICLTEKSKQWVELANASVRPEIRLGNGIIWVDRLHTQN